MKGMGLLRSVSFIAKKMAKNKENEPEPCFAPFVTQGFVSLTGNPKHDQPVKILRDTGGSQTIIKEGALSENSTC